MASPPALSGSWAGGPPKVDQSRQISDVKGSNSAHVKDTHKHVRQFHDQGRGHRNGGENGNGNGNGSRNGQPRQRSPSHQPKNSSEDEQMYILTLWTDNDLHQSMNNLRKKYFPPHLNFLDAHITLFHALPESQLEGQIMPSIQQLVERTSTFELAATTPFKLKKGIAVGLPKDHGGDASRNVHTTLVRQWSDFLSQQDFSFQAHFTIMNKVDDEKVIEKTFKDVKDGWKPTFGTAQGLSLWKYHPKGWELIKNLSFKNR